MKRTGTLVIGACVASFATGTASAAPPDSSWYIAPSVYALWLDDARQADDDLGASLAFGRTFTANWDVEVGAFLSKHDRADDATLELRGFDIQAKRVFYRGDARVNPFLSIGMAHVQNSLGGDDTNFAMTYGAGLLIDLNPSRDDGRSIALRADLGARRAFSGDSDTVDYIAGLGLQFSWGRTVTPRIVDSDGDGVTDDADKCPGTPAGTAVDTTGCPLPVDDDGDGVINDHDKCPGTTAGAKVDSVGCELDSDGDGVADGRDQCPNTPAGAKVNEKGCETDGDGDGIVDSLDKCPDTPPGQRVNNSGCPFDGALLLQGVKFRTDSSEMLPESIPVLESASATLKRYPTASIEVAGYTDSRGSDAYNLQLSARRAATVVKYLQDAGVTNTLTSNGYGEQEPIASNATEAGRQLNRRVILRPLN